MALLLSSSTLFAQSATTGSIGGVVKDATGAVLPGVTVEVASPALIEKVRVALTDRQGNYKVVDLRPGTFSVTFTLPGFSTFKREGIELTTGFTATANAELKVGALEETVTVTGASPVVDVQNVRTQNVLSQEVLDSIPTNKTIQSFAALTLGASPGSARNQDVGGNKGEAAESAMIHGNRSQDAKLMLDGMNMNHNMNQAGGSNKGVTINQSAILETVLEVGGLSAEAETGGIQFNFVPKDGGNVFRFYSSGNYTSSGLQGGNVNDSLTSRGVTGTAKIKRIYDLGVGVGGPIVKDRLWFYTAHRWWGSQEYQPGAFFNKTQGTVFYTPDLDRPAFIDIWDRDSSARLTWQASPKNKITTFFDYQRGCQCWPLVSALFAPESMTDWNFLPWIAQGTWNLPVSNRLLIEGGAIYVRNKWHFPPTKGSNVTPDTIGIFDLSRGVFYGALAGNEGLVQGAGTPAPGGQNTSPQTNGRASLSYVTGSHALKFGMQFRKGWHHQNHTINQDISYFFQGTNPLLISQFATPFIHDELLDTLALFAQDQWRVKRLTLNLGVRFDRLHASTVAEDLPPSRFLPARHYDAVDNVPNWRNVTPRFGGSYDVTGDGRTAIKASVGRFLAGQGVGLAQDNHPALALVRSANRVWIDTNGNKVPDCDLHNFGANGECFALNNQAFGQPLRNTFFASDMLEGWDARPFNWQASAAVQRELRPGVGVSTSYFRTWYGNFTVTQNRKVTAGSFDPFCVTAPTDSRLPGGGGNQICGLYDVKPASFGQVESLVQKGLNGGQTEVYDGIEVAISARFSRGGLLTGGVGTGRTVTDSCYLNNRPDVVPSGGSATNPRTDRYCRVTLPWSAQTQIKFAGSYPLPAQFNVSAMLQNLSGVPQSANFVVSNTAIAPSLGRNLSAGAGGTVTVPAVVANTMFEDRLTQVDVRLSRTFRVGASRVQAQFDVYNLFNANTVLASNGTYGSAWLQPIAILGARLAKFGFQMDW